MIKQGYGHIIFISSTYAFHPMFNAAVYQASKIAIKYLATSLKLEAKGKIKSSIVYPSGGSATKLTETVVGRDDNSKVMFCNQENYDQYYGYAKAKAEGTADPDLGDVRSIKNLQVTADIVSDTIMFVMNQPWGLNIREIVVGATNEPLLL
jgi:NADP-dependent 3-hydroxy acid dehydrogenase YdfG